jgi:hypothetical protein
MLDYLHLHLTRSPPDHLQEALADWLTIGLHTGLRSSEYCQTATNARSGRFKLNLDNDPTAFLYRDFRFYCRDREELPFTQLQYTSPTELTSISITWRRQKNAQVDTDRTLVRNDQVPHRCPVRAILRVVQRALRYNIPHHHPLAIYLASTRTAMPVVHYLSDLLIREKLRELAVGVHHVTDPADLKKYTTHSVRVGACVLLFLANVPKDIIKFCLRWMGESWTEYLRHLPALAAQQIRAINNTGVYDAVRETGTLPTV